MKPRIPGQAQSAPRINRNELQQYLRLVRTYLRPYWREVLVLVVGYFAFTGLNVVQPLVMAPVLDIAIGGGDSAVAPPAANQLMDLDLNNLGAFVLHRFGLDALDPWNTILILGLAYAGIAILISLVTYGNSLLMVHLRYRTLTDMQRNLYEHLIGLSLDFFNRQRSGEIVSRMEQDTRATIGNLQVVAQNLIVQPLLILVYGYLLVRTNLLLTLLIAVAGLIQFLISTRLRVPIRKLIVQQQSETANAGAYVYEMLASVRVVKTFVAENATIQQLKANHKKIYASGLRQAYIKETDKPLAGIINGVTNAAILFMVARELISGALTPAGFFLYLYVGRSVLNPINHLVAVYNSFQQTMASEQRLRELMAEQPTIVSGTRPVPDFEQGLKLETVNFQYGEEPTVHEIDFEIQKGEMVALVGPSGAGKSTITDLLLRFYDPKSGRILLDGVDIRDLNLEDYRRLFGSVAQENQLFNATVAENIAFARPDIDRDEIRRAAEIANAHEFISQLPEGYDTMIGDRGVLISGGQRQRLAIARAIVRRPKILILDEATSSLDSISEKLVQDAIDRVIQDTTAIVIAHRLSTVRNASKIVVLNGGRVEDIGTHDELMQRCPVYIDLANLQFKTT